MQTHSKARPAYRAGRLLIDGRTGDVRKDGVLISLTPTEFEVLSQLVERKGDVVLYEEFKPWECKAQGADRRHPVFEVVVRLRKKVGNASTILSVRKRGYRLSPTIAVEEIASYPEEIDRLGWGALRRLNDHTRQAVLTSTEKYEELVRHNPTDVEALVHLVLNYINQASTGFCLALPQRMIGKTRERLEQALAYRPNLSSAYALRALTYLIYDHDWDRAEKDLNTALSHNEHDGYAHSFLAHMDVSRGKFESGLRHAREAAALDSENAITVFTVPWLLVLAEQPDNAMLEAEKALRDFDPFAVGHVIYGHVFQATGNIDHAIEEYKRALEIEFFPDALACLGHAHAVAGNRRAALDCLAKFKKLKSDAVIPYVPGYYEALIYAGLGDTEKALSALEIAFNQKCDWLIHLMVEPRWNKLRKERRFLKLLQKVGLKSRLTARNERPV